MAFQFFFTEMLAIAFIFFVAAGKLAAIEISCERVDRFDTFQKSCYLNETTEIRAVNVTVNGLENSEIETIIFDYNKKIRFLPLKVYKKYPNLKQFLARRAAVKQISALNFEKLLSLKILSLLGNEIEFIPNDCFQGLTQLQELFLSKISVSVWKQIKSVI